MPDMEPILSAEFRNFLMQSEVHEAFQVFPIINGTNVLVIGFCVLVIIGAITESVKAIKNTIQYRNK